MTNPFAPPAATEELPAKTGREAVLVKVELSLALVSFVFAPVAFFLVWKSEPRTAVDGALLACCFVVAGVLIGGAGLIQRCRSGLRWAGQLLGVVGLFYLLGSMRFLLLALVYE